MKQDSHNNLHHHIMGSNNFNLFCCYFRRSAFYRALLESKTHTPVLEILATKTHYPNIPRLQQTSCATRKKNPTRCCILEATINRVAAVWARMYSVWARFPYRSLLYYAYSFCSERTIEVTMDGLWGLLALFY